MIKISKHIYCLILIIFILGLLFTITNKPKSLIEGFKKQDCPNILIQEGKHLVLYNSRLARIPGINPVKFNNLEDYVVICGMATKSENKLPCFIFTTFLRPTR